MASAEQNVTPRLMPRPQNVLLDRAALTHARAVSEPVLQQVHNQDLVFSAIPAEVRFYPASSDLAQVSEPLKRTFDVILAIAALPILSLPMLAIAVLVYLTSRGPVLYWSDRMGRGNRIFPMPKFRTMRINTPQVASREMKEPAKYLTPIGSFLRRTSLDELPQIFSILKGDLSFVGPRPLIASEEDVLSRRTELGIHELTPGLTGLAQINGRDRVNPRHKVALDLQYLQNRSLWLDLKIIVATVPKVIMGSDVTH